MKQFRAPPTGRTALNIGRNKRVHGPARAAQSKRVNGAALINKAAQVLRVLGQSGDAGVQLSDVSKQLNFHRATAHRILAALRESGLVEQNAHSKRYHLGPELIVLGQSALTRLSLREVAHDSCVRICNETADTVFLSVKRGHESICVDRFEGSYPIKVLTLSIGSIRPLGVGAGSLAILASMKEVEVDKVLSNIDALLPYAKYTASKLHKLVDRTRVQGYAYNDQMIIDGMSAIGVPLLRNTGDVAGAISVAAVSSRMSADRQAQIIEMLKEEAASISERI